MDLIIRNANLPDGRIGIDIGIKDGKIVALEVALTAKAQKEIDASGYLVSPSFVDAHFHMDATLSLGLATFESVRNFAGRHSLVGRIKAALNG